MVKALAAGAHVVMLGSMFAGVAESPGETEFTKVVNLKCIVVWVLSVRWKKEVKIVTSKKVIKACPRRY